MSHTRLQYDDCAYRHELKESVGPGEYLLATPRVDCEYNCFFPSPGIALGRNGAAVCEKELIDVDSELMGISRKATLCPTNKYLPMDKPFCPARKLKDCSALSPEDTRISNGPCTLRGIPNGFNRWEWLCKNPQEKALVPFDFNINNRIIVKDAHRPCIPNLMDQSAALPPASNMSVCYDWSTKWAADQYIPKIDAQNPPSWTLTVCPKIAAL